MDSQGIFGGTLSILEKVLDLRSRKHNMIVSNIANIDTPQYKAFDMIMDKELQRVVRADESSDLRKTNDKHFSRPTIQFESEGWERSDDSEWSVRKDGNTVDLDRAMADLAKNSLMYNALAQIISKKFIDLKSAIQGGDK
jgi:flagellar basal-body rod protein FlgB